MSNSKLTEFQIKEIIIKYNLNMTQFEIAQNMNININTVYLWVNKYKNNKSLTTTKGRGPKNKLTKDQENLIIILLNSNKYWKIPNLIIEMEKQHKITISETTMRRILKNNNFKFRKRIIKPLLTKVHKNIRMQFCLTNYYTNWLNIIFSDETKIIKDQHTGKYWIGPDDTNINETFRHPIKRNVWGCITSGGIGTIYIFKDILTADKYTNILKDYLLPIYNSNYIFQQDNDPKHTALKTSLFIIDSNIKLLLWPPNSPDLNPIENIWGCLKNLLEKETDLNDTNFDEKIIKCWNNIKYETVFNSINSMNCRICQVIQNEGDHINY